MIIFTGTGRSGTGWLAQCFSAQHEFRARQFIKVQWPEMEYDWSDPQRRIAAMRWLLTGVDIKTFADSCNLYVHFLDALYAIDPTVKIVVCERNREDYVKSAVNRGWHAYKGYHCAPAPSDAISASWASMSPQERCGWQWSFRLNKARERLAAVPPESYLWCHLEDITQDLLPVEQFLGMPANDEWRDKHYIRGRSIYA